MATAFQIDAFQQGAFQGEGEQPPVEDVYLPRARGGGGSGGVIRSQKDIEATIDRVLAKLEGREQVASVQAVAKEARKEMPGLTYAQVRAALAVIREEEEETEVAEWLAAA